MCESGQRMAQELDPRAGAYLLGRLVSAIDSGRLDAEPSLTERLRAAVDNLESISKPEGPDSDSVEGQATKKNS